ncbi:GCN5-related N-acetyltransferase 10, chloroplastic [Aristolochia californica]|uniref:GCN5-related N-acetyltransferase 10, chloroplastic n=1 Tax=Aristolochia californica TaxID=171875 RepID=UPI0035DFF68F
MAHLKAWSLSLFPNLCNEFQFAAESKTRSDCALKRTTTSTKISFYSKKGRDVVGCRKRASSIYSRNYEQRHNGVCSSTSAGEVGFVGQERLRNLVSEFGWRVRRMAENDSEMSQVADVQAEAFHTPMPFFDDLFFQFFKAEVLAALIYRLRNSPPDRYACLVAEPNCASDSLNGSKGKVVGVVNVTVMRDEDVLSHIDHVEEYLYVSGIAVLQEFRRQKVATVLLKACDLLSLLWGYKYLVLWAYEDDLGARTLYSSAGYSVVSGDPHWMTTWIGRKRRVLMVKPSGLSKYSFTHELPLLLQNISNMFRY